MMQSLTCKYFSHLSKVSPNGWCESRHMALIMWSECCAANSSSQPSSSRCSADSSDSLEAEMSLIES